MLKKKWRIKFYIIQKKICVSNKEYGSIICNDSRIYYIYLLWGINGPERSQESQRILSRTHSWFLFTSRISFSGGYGL